MRIQTFVVAAATLLGSTASAQAYTSAASFLGAAGTPSYTETFETMPALRFKNTPYAFLTKNGITYTGLAGVPTFNVWVASPGFPNFGVGLSPTTTSILTSNGDEDFLISFLTPYYAVGFDVYYNGLGPAVSKFYNGATLLGSIGYGGAAVLGYNGFVSTPSSLITSVRFTSTRGGVLNTGIDNFSVVGTPLSTVPEPASLALLATGLAGLLAVRRRR